MRKLRLVLLMLAACATMVAWAEPVAATTCPCVIFAYSSTATAAHSAEPTPLVFTAEERDEFEVFAPPSADIPIPELVTVCRVTVGLWWNSTGATEALEIQAGLYRALPLPLHRSLGMPGFVLQPGNGLGGGPYGGGESHSSAGGWVSVAGWDSVRVYSSGADGAGSGDLRNVFLNVECR
jgi:hypothetical protein